MRNLRQVSCEDEDTTKIGFHICIGVTLTEILWNTANIYLLKVSNRNNKKGVKYVKS